MTKKILLASTLAAILFMVSCKKEPVAINEEEQINHIKTYTYRICYTSKYLYSFIFKDTDGEGGANRYD